MYDASYRGEPEKSPALMDQTLFHLINEQWTSPALDLFMAAISNIESWKPCIVLIVLYAIFFRGFKGRALVFCCLVALLISSALMVRTLKAAVDRRRPKQVERERLVDLQNSRPEFLNLFERPTIRYSNEQDRKASGPSFPSGHVANNITIAVILTFFFRRWGWLYFFVAGAIGYSRIYLAAHWPSDVLATIFLAAGETLLVLALVEMGWRWAGRKWAPELFARHPRIVGDAIS
jgi:undecaprenyl-diphosphatase